MANTILWLAVILAGCTGTTDTDTTDTGDDLPTCETDLIVCDDGCTDLLDDAANCSACGKECAGTEECVEGTCMAECPIDKPRCDGACTDLFTSDDHCGSCDNACVEGDECFEGGCVTECEPAEDRCDGTCTDLQVDHANCGTCGTTCGDNEVCNAGACDPVCLSHETLFDGACYDLAADVENCGTVGTACDVDGAEVCIHGTCAVPCDEPTDCADPDHACFQVEFFDPANLASVQISLPYDTCEMEDLERYCGNPFQCAGYGDTTGGSPDNWTTGIPAWCEAGDIAGLDQPVCRLVDRDAMNTFRFVRKN